MNEALLRELYETTELPLAALATEVGSSYKVVQKYVAQHYTQEQRKERKHRTYRNSKLGDKNPMTGKSGAEHHNYIGGVVSDGKGYLMALKPEWYTGRPGSNYIFQHVLVMCEALGLSELPGGFVVHHVDHNPTNNDLNNLALLTSSAHSRLHSRERATTIPQGSRGKCPEAPSPSTDGDDIVCSAR
jgi:hypothetical protein